MKCPKCYLVHPDSVTKCYCGYEFNNQSGFSAGGNNRRTFNFHGNGFDLFSIFIVNVLLIIVTLGVYYFWGKVKIKRYLYSQLEFDGDRFSFHGTGKELFLGGIIGLIFLGLTIGLQHLIDTSKNNYILAASIILLLAFFSLIPVIFVLSRRYYLSRSSWRGIRFSFRGKISSFYRIIIRGFLLTIVTFGLYAPFLRNRIKDYFIGNSYFGNQKFSYSGNGNEVFKHYAKAFFLYIPVTALTIFLVISVLGILLGLIINKDIKSISLIIASVCTYLSFYIVFFWFEFWFTKYVWNHTTFMNTKFTLNITFIPYIKLKTGNLLIYILTLGLGWPWVAVRNNKFLTERLVLEGDLDFDTVKQQFIKSSATGESVADIFDIGAGLDLGI
ncbi:MAG: YjgN family protein [Thermodesulfobacteriota bacterium]